MSLSARRGQSSSPRGARGPYHSWRRRRFAPPSSLPMPQGRRQRPRRPPRVPDGIDCAGPPWD
eukprot:6999191-Lingulodinium_polyedra.AAC.1